LEKAGRIKEMELGSINDFNVVSDQSCLSNWLWSTVTRHRVNLEKESVLIVNIVIYISCSWYLCFHIYVGNYRGKKQSL